MLSAGVRARCESVGVVIIVYGLLCSGVFLLRWI